MKIISTCTPGRYIGNMTDSESDTESLGAQQDKAQPRTSWIYTLKSDQLKEELKKFGLPLTGKMRDHRRTLSSFIKGDFQLPVLQKTSDSAKPALGLLPGQPSGSSTVAETVSPIAKHDLSICNTVRKWNLNFDGDKDVVLFLERLNELREAYDTTPEQLLGALPELLKGKALLWYRNSKSLWTNWDGFLKCFELQYMPRRFREKLDIEIRARTQGQNEPFKDYLVAIQTLMRRHGQYQREQQFNQIYENMLPEYKLYGLRNNIISLPELIQAANDYEAIKQSVNDYRPPVNAAQSMYPDIAYQGKREESGDRTYSSGGRPRLQNGRRQDLQISSPRAQIEKSHPCWNCGKPGHFSKDCRLPRKDTCRFCGRDGKTMTCTCRDAVNYQRTWRGRGAPRP